MSLLVFRYGLSLHRVKAIHRRKIAKHCKSEYGGCRGVILGGFYHFAAKLKKII